MRVAVRIAKTLGSIAVWALIIVSGVLLIVIGIGPHFAHYLSLIHI